MLDMEIIALVIMKYVSLQYIFFVYILLLCNVESFLVQSHVLFWEQRYTLLIFYFYNYGVGGGGICTPRV